MANPKKTDDKIADTAISKLSSKDWDSIVMKQIENLTKSYTQDAGMQKILSKWHRDVTIGYKHNDSFSPHVNGFYMIFMVHGPWYKSLNGKASQSASKKAWNKKADEYLSGYDNGVPDSGNEAGISEPLGKHGIPLDNPNSYLNMLATDIDVPDITEEYISVSSRIRNSFVPSRDYFVSDFSISYIENLNLDVMRYHEAWHKYLNLIKRGEIGSMDFECDKKDESYFIDLPYSNATWIAIFKPFTTEIQALIKLIGVMPVTLPLKQIIGNRSASKMTVLNMSYKSADIFYKFYKDTDDFLGDDGLLARAFKREVLKI